MRLHVSAIEPHRRPTEKTFWTADHGDATADRPSYVICELHKCVPHHILFTHHLSVH